MKVLEALVRDTLADHATDAPSDDGLLDAVTRRRPRRWPAVLAAAAVVLLAAGLAIVMSSSSGPDRQAAGPTSPPTAHPTSGTPTTSSAFAGTPMKFVSYHGIVLAVPQRLPVLTNPCAQPREYVVASDPDVAYSCPAQPPSPRPTFTVSLTTDPAVHGSGHIRYQHTADHADAGGVLSVAGSPVRVTVTAPSPVWVRRILTSVRRGADGNGCPATFGPVSNPPDGSLVPGSPTGAVRCVYATGRWLLASIPLTGAQGLAQRIDNLPKHNPQPAGLVHQSYESDLLRFHYTDGTTRTLSVTLGTYSTFRDGQRVGYDLRNRGSELLRRTSR